MGKFKIYIKENILVKEKNSSPNSNIPNGNKIKPKLKKKSKSFDKIIGEVIDPNTIDVNNLAKKNELSPDIWDSEDKMNPEVRNILLKNALEFLKFCKLDTVKFKDIILTGSLANYNYNDNSDLDVHVLMDFSQISDDTELVSDYFKTKKSLWADRLPVKVRGHDVEVYLQDINETHTTTGVYSILKDNWLTKPIKEMIAIDVKNIQLKSSDIMDAIDNLQTSNNIDDIAEKSEALMEKIKEYRKAGLQKEGEFSTENLVFKILRNSGYLEKLADLKYDELKKELTLEDLNTNIENEIYH